MINKEGGRIGPIVLGACALLYLLFRFGPHFQNGSPDYVLHFTLVNEIMNSAGVSPDAASRISAMAFYPDASHWMAAIIGWISGSGLVGISLVSVAAAFFTYLFAVRIVADTPVRLVLFFVGFLLLRRTYSLVGWEVVSNFFYPQLVGDAFYFLALLLLVKTERFAHRSAFFIVAGSLVMWVQPLNALHIVATGCVMLALEGVKLWRVRRAFPFRYAAAVIGVVIVAAVVLVANPEFKLMRQISSNNGALEFLYKHIMTMVAACAVICALNAWRYISRGAAKSDLVISAAGLAACALATLQFLAWELHGDGSPYAVKKHMFIVVTVAMMNAVRLIGAFERGDISDMVVVNYATPLVTLYMSTFALQGFTEPLAPTIRAFAYAREIAAYQFPKMTPENTVSADGSLSLLANALISRVAFNHQMDYRWWSGMKITDGVKYAMVRRTPTSDEACAPQYAWTSEYVIVDSTCLTVYKPGDTLSFSTTGDGRSYLGHNWYNNEPWGTWAMGDGEIQFTIPKSSTGPYQLDVDAMAYISDHHGQQKFDVEVNGEKVAEWNFATGSAEGKQTATIPAELIKDGSVKIVFRAPGAVSPKQIGDSIDGRVFGIGLKTLTLRTSPQ